MLWCQAFDFREESKQAAGTSSQLTHFQLWYKGQGLSALSSLFTNTMRTETEAFCILQAGSLGISLAPSLRTQFMPPNAPL